MAIKLNIREDWRNGKVFYYLYRNNKFVQHIGDAEDLRVFKRNVQIGEQAIEHLQRGPYLAPRSCLNIICE